jgi:hypothetical protein
MTDKLATAPTQPAMVVDNFTAFLERAARDPSIDVAKLKELLAMKREQDALEAKRLYFTALASLQSKLDPIAKSGTNKHTGSKYVLLDDLLNIIRPLLQEEGFALTFDSKPSAQVGASPQIEFTCEMVHTAGHSETRRLVLPVDGTGSKGGHSSMNDVQKVGSTTTYARRYLLDMHLNLARRGEDDDGNGGPKPVTQEQVASLRDALRAKNAGQRDVDTLVAFAGATSLETIPETSFKRCVDAVARMKVRA